MQNSQVLMQRFPARPAQSNNIPSALQVDLSVKLPHRIDLKPKESCLTMKTAMYQICAYAYY